MGVMLGTGDTIMIKTSVRLAPLKLTVYTDREQSNSHSSI